MRIRALTTSVAVLATVVAAPQAAAAPAPGLTCGDVVEGHVALTADLVCRGSAVGLVLAEGATLDLGGHQVVGDGTGTGLELPPHSDVTIRDGVVRGWETGVELHSFAGDDAAQVRLESLTFRGNGSGAELTSLGREPLQIAVDDSRFVGNDVGVRAFNLYGTDASIDVTASRFTDNRVGLLAMLSIATTDDSQFAHNGTGVSCEESTCDVTDTHLRDNGVAVRSTGYGHLEVRRSTVTRNDVGVDSSWALPGPTVIDSNLLRDNGTAVHLYLANAVVKHNRFLRNDVGFVAENSAEDPENDQYAAELEGNEFQRNGDGVLSVAHGTTLRLNTAIRNERWGIHAPGAVDLGGNTARRNGNSPQCVGVDCGESGPRS